MDMQNMKEVIIMLAIVAIIGAAASIAINDFFENTRDDDVTGIINESITIASCSGKLTRADYFVFGSESLVNGTDSGGGGVGVNNALGSTANISSSGSVVCGAEAGACQCNTTISANYTYYVPTHQYNMSVFGLQGEANATGFLDTIGTVIGIAVLIGIVIGAFYFVTKR